MFVLKHSKAFFWSLGIAVTPASQAWGIPSEGLTEPPVSAKSCVRGDCLVRHSKFEPNPQILQSDEVLKFTENTLSQTSSIAAYSKPEPIQPHSDVYVSSHFVDTGDTLYNISKRYSVSVDELKSANDLSDSKIGIGQLLTIPTSEKHVLEKIDLSKQAILPRKLPQIIQTAQNNFEDEITVDDEINNTPLIPVLKPANDPIGDYLKEQNATKANDKAKTISNQPSFEIGLPMLMDNRYLGDVTVRVMGDIVRVDGRSMLRLLKPDLTEKALRDLEALITEEFLIINDIEIDGLDVSYDPALQQVDVKTPIDSRQRQALRLGAEPLDRNISLLEPGKFSFFVTPILSSLYDWDGADRGFQPIRGSVNVGGRIFGEKGIGFLSRQSFTSGSNGGFRRNETTAYYDRLDKLIRVSAGDLRPRGLGFQSTPRIAGLSLERFFNLEPNRLFRPTADSSFELERPSTVDVRLNGITRREIVLQPGRYNIDDLPLVQGSNLVDLVIRDDLGQERIISDQSFFDFGLLEPGISDFSLSAGVKADTTNTGVNYTDDLAVTGFYRRGLGKNFTVGIDAQGDSTGGNSGVSTLLATALGVFRLEASASDYNDVGKGYAGEFGYRYLGGDRGDWSFSFTGNARYFSKNFSTLRNSNNVSIDIGQIGQDVVFDQTLNDTIARPFSVLLNGSARLRKGRVTLSTAASHNIGRRGTVDRTNVIGGITYQLNNRMSVGTFGRHSIFEGTSETSANVQLNYRFGRGRTLRANYDTSFNELDVQYNKAAAIGVGSLSYSVSSRSNFNNDTHGLSANAFYTGNRFEANLDHSLVNQSGGIDGDFQQFSQASLSSSLVFVDGAFGVGRPVQSTFAILQPHETLKGRKIVVNPTESGYNASSDLLGPAVASEGQAFSTRSTYYDVEDLPIGYDLGEGQYSTRAPLYAGYKVKVGSGASFTVMGHLRDKLTGDQLPNYGGRLEPLDNPSAETVPAFTNRNGRLAATGIKPGRYKLIIFNDPSFEKIITIPEDGEPLIQLGNMELTVK